MGYIMKSIRYELLIILILSVLLPTISLAQSPVGHFVPGRDLFLPQFDSKTDVDDLHSVAGVATVLSDARLGDVDYHAVAGAYGIQDGLYVPSPGLFEQAFGANWSDAHGDREQALQIVSGRVAETLAAGGVVWVAEAGQSDFTADWLMIIRQRLPEIDTRTRVHVVQHSDWNESVTSPDKLAYVKQHAAYHKIPDGNALDNGSPGLRMFSSHLWRRAVQNPATGPAWGLARTYGLAYNGREGRYDNAAVGAGGMDFSDVSETCWIFGFADLRNADAFFGAFAAKY
jgi:hypothetical protein